MKNPMEEILAPVRQKAAEANAPLFAQLGVTPEQLERVMEPLPLAFFGEALVAAAAKAAVRGATTF